MHGQRGGRAMAGHCGAGEGGVGNLGRARTLREGEGRMIGWVWGLACGEEGGVRTRAGRQEGGARTVRGGFNGTEAD